MVNTFQIYTGEMMCFRNSFAFFFKNKSCKNIQKYKPFKMLTIYLTNYCMISSFWHPINPTLFITHYKKKHPVPMCCKGM